MIQGIRIGNLGIDCKNAQALRDFYAKLLSWEAITKWDAPAAVSPEGFVLLFDGEDDCAYVPPVWPEEPGRQQKQMHLDFQVDDLMSAVKEAESLGAAKAKEQFGGNHFITMFDPEGHPFCLCAKD